MRINHYWTGNRSVDMCRSADDGQEAITIRLWVHSSCPERKYVGSIFICQIRPNYWALCEMIIKKMSCITALNDEPNDVLSASSLGKKVHRWCSCCHKPSKVYKIFAPLISHPDLDLNGFQQTWMRESYLRYVQKIDRISIDALSRFKNIRRSLIVLGVLISGCIIVSETDHVKDHHVAANILFWVTMFISLMNNFVTAFLTDLKLAERAILFYRGSAYLQAMGQNFLTRTQRYAMFSSCGEGFRTFVRDVEMTKLLITSEDISLMSSSREQKPDDPISKER